VLPALHLDISIGVDDGVELRPLRLEDAEPMYYLIQANRARLTEWLPWVPGMRAAADEASFIRGAHQELQAGAGLSCALVVDRAIAGTIGCSIKSESRSAEIGYWIAETSEGRGLVTRAVHALTTFLVTDVDLHRIVIRAATANTRSRAIPERLGFTHEGTQRHAEILNGEFFDLEVYSMLAPEWPTNGAH
jgi:ribosomal-protein-serine acetyltransferase